MLFAESAVVGLIAGVTGTLLGAGVIWSFGRHGIPATGESLAFFFSGARLYPAVSVKSMAFALGAVLVVGLCSGIYPGLVAMRVSPREAMQSED
jgi:ABC-type antimicrobial peptide transport system permease subunit